MTDRNKHPDPFDDRFADTILQMARDGLVTIDGDKVTLTDKGRAALKSEGKTQMEI